MLWRATGARRLFTPFPSSFQRLTTGMTLDLGGAMSFGGEPSLLSGVGSSEVALSPRTMGIG